jgi:hypothetical protein
MVHIGVIQALYGSVVENVVGKSKKYDGAISR